MRFCGFLLFIIYVYEACKVQFFSASTAAAISKSHVRITTTKLIIFGLHTLYSLWEVSHVLQFV